MKPKVLALLVLLALLLGMVACGEKTTPTTAATAQSYWPTEAWRTSTPEEQGMDSEMLADMLETIHEQDYDVDGVVVVRNGYMVVDAAIIPVNLRLEGPSSGRPGDGAQSLSLR